MHYGNNDGGYNIGKLCSVDNNKIPDVFIMPYTQNDESRGKM
jgi:hypothetical protein